MTVHLVGHGSTTCTNSINILVMEALLKALSVRHKSFESCRISSLLLSVSTIRTILIYSPFKIKIVETSGTKKGNECEPVSKACYNE